MSNAKIFLERPLRYFNGHTINTFYLVFRIFNGCIDCTTIPITINTFTTLQYYKSKIKGYLFPDFYLAILRFFSSLIFLSFSKIYNIKESFSL